MGKVKSDKHKKRKTFFRAWRLHSKQTLEQVAEKLDVTASALGQLEREEINYTQPMLEALADVYRCHPVDLLIRDPREPESPWTLWESLTAAQRKQAIAVLEALKSTS
jgi:transcriptional regulator with XRE-family HTH domain